MTMAKDPADESTRTIVRDLAEASRDLVRHQPTAERQDGLCAVHKSDIDEIKSGVADILNRLAKGDTHLALLEHRVQQLERIVFGMCGVALLAVVGGLVALVVR